MLRRNVLIFHNAALGDFVLTWPIAIALSRVMAQSRVKYVTASEKGRLAERAIGVEFVDVETGWHTLHAEGGEVAEGPAKLLGGLQLGIVFAQQSGGEGATHFADNLRRHGGDVPILVIAPNPPAGVHVWQHQLDQLVNVPWLAAAAAQVQAAARQRALVAVPPGEASHIVIHPGSGAARKNWPIENFHALAAQLKAAGRRVTFVIGEAERERLSAGEVARLREVAAVASPPTLVELFDLLSTAATYIGNDSGPTHLAAAMGRRTVALFGPTSDAAAWGPIGPAVTLLPFEATVAGVAAEALADDAP